MILALDTLGERYGMLPSQVLGHASTIDLYVMDAALSYHEYKSNKAQNKVDPKQYTTDELQNMLASARNRQ